MKKNIIVAGLAIFAAYFTFKITQSSQTDAVQNEFGNPFDGLFESLFTPLNWEETEMRDESLIERRRQAFLTMIRQAEGTENQPDPYATLYGYVTFPGFSYATHPANVGWKGVKLSDEMCRNAGYGPGCVSTAAGAYQITKPTWNRLASKIKLPDFSPASQDLAALELVKENNALYLVDEGDIANAVKRVGRIWASLPGNTYQQNAKSLEQVLAMFNAALYA